MTAASLPIKHMSMWLWLRRAFLFEEMTAFRNPIPGAIGMELVQKIFVVDGDVSVAAFRATGA
jgi:hypothetical protein